jgi:hypothetical protein
VIAPVGEIASAIAGKFASRAIAATGEGCACPDVTGAGRVIALRSPEEEEEEEEEEDDLGRDRQDRIGANALRLTD